MMIKASMRNRKTARPMSIRIKTGVRAGGGAGVIMPNHNETFVTARRIETRKTARPVSLRIKTGVRAGGGVGVVMPNHNETFVTAGRVARARA